MLPFGSVSWRNSVFVCLCVALVALGVFGLRIVNVNQSFDVFIDEITYLRISEQVRATGDIELYGKSFYLHPPAFFFVQAAYLNLITAADNPIHAIYDSRFLNLIISAVGGVALFLIGYYASKWQWGLLSAFFFAFDAFVIRMNSRNLLDTLAIFFTLLGYLVLVHALARNPYTISRRQIIFTSVFFGLGILTKDMIAFLTLVPLGILFVMGWSLPRRAVLSICLLTTFIYLLYPLAIAIGGNFDTFINEKFGGILRLIGTNRETGVNRDSGPSFLETIISNLNEFGMTYLLIGLGVFAVLILLWHRGKISRLIAVWTGSTYLLMAYLIAFGTLEEQFFYFLLVPCLVAIPLAIQVLIEENTLRRVRPFILSGLTILILAFTGWSGKEWINRHFVPDNGYEQALNYIQNELPDGSLVAATSETAQFLMGENASGPYGLWNLTADLLAYSPSYVLVNEQQVAWDFGTSALPLLDWISEKGTPVFEFRSHTNDLILYKLDY